MSNEALNNEDNLRRIWDTYNTLLQDTPDAVHCNLIDDVLEYEYDTPIDQDLIGLQDVHGIDIFRQSDTEPFQVEMECFDPLGSDPRTVTEWLQRGPIGPQKANALEGIRILLGAQILNRDRLRPFQENAGCVFERKVLSEAFHLPAASIAKFGRQQRFCLTFPGTDWHTVNNCTYGMNDGSIAALWTRHGTMTYCFLVDRFQHETRERLFWLLHHLKNLCTARLFIPFVLADVEATTQSHNLTTLLQRDVRSMGEVAKYLGGGNSSQTENAASYVDSLAQNAGSYSQRTGLMRAIIRMRDLVIDIPVDVTGRENDCISDSDKGLQKMLDFRIDEMKDLIRVMEDHVESTSRELKDRINIASHRLTVELAESQTSLIKDGHIQQAQAVELAKATHMIGEATLKDSASMKTLAIVAMIYLPATTVSTIMSMPLFDWNSPHISSVINSRFWVYLAIALPLTTLTVLCWWLWLHKEEVCEALRHKHLRKSEP